MKLWKAKLIKEVPNFKYLEVGKTYGVRVNKKHGTYMIHENGDRDARVGLRRETYSECFKEIESK